MEILPEGSRDICPYCNRDRAVIPLMVRWWCNDCNKSFSVMEAEQHREIKKLNLIIKRLREVIKGNKKCAA